MTFNGYEYKDLTTSCKNRAYYDALAATGEDFDQAYFAEHLAPHELFDIDGNLL